MSDYLRKIKNLQRKVNYRNSQTKIEIDVIMDSSHPKYDWSIEDWRQYIQHEKRKGNTVIYLFDEYKKQQQEHLAEYERLEQELEQYEQLELALDEQEQD